jgi:hypothetical protein
MVSCADTDETLPDIAATAASAPTALVHLFIVVFIASPLLVISAATQR